MTIIPIDRESGPKSDGPNETRLAYSVTMWNHAYEWLRDTIGSIGLKRPGKSGL
jgi:hypothetical protein